MPILDLSQYFRQYIKYKCMLLGIEVDRLNFLNNCFLSQCNRLIVSFLRLPYKIIVNYKVVQRITKPPIEFIFLTTFTYLDKNKYSFFFHPINTSLKVQNKHTETT